MKKKTFYAGKKPYRNYRQLAAYAIVIVGGAAIIAGIVFGVNAIVNYSREKKASRAENFGKYTWETQGFEGYSSIKCLGESFLVYTRGESGLMGLMSLSGEPISDAEYSEFSSVEEPWRSKTFLAQKSGSQYKLVIDSATQKITAKQYRAPLEPVGVAYWDTSANSAAWYDSVGYVGKHNADELALADGLYPVQSHDGTRATGAYGFVDENLALAVPLDYLETHEFSCGLAGVMKKGGCGYVGSDGKTAIALDFESVSSLEVNEEISVFTFSDGLVPAKKGGKMGIIDTDGKTVVDFDFEVILPGAGGIYIGKDAGKWGKITVEQKDGEKYVTTTAVQTTQAAAIAGGTYIVNTKKDPLNIRAQASAESAIVAQVPKGTSVEVSKSANGWAYVKYHSAGGKDFVGWVNATFLKKSESASPATTSAAATTAQSTTKKAG